MNKGRRRVLLFALPIIMLLTLLQSTPVRALDDIEEDTASETSISLFNIYMGTSDSAVSLAEARNTLTTATEDFTSAKRRILSVESLNTAIAASGRVNEQLVEVIEVDIKTLTDKNKEIQESLTNDIELSAQSLIAADLQYKLNLKEIEALYSNMATYRLPDIQDSDEESKEYADSLLALRSAESAYSISKDVPILGDVSNVKIPVAGQYRITSPFGVRVDPITLIPGAFHGGLDIASPHGTDVVSLFNGIVVEVVPDGGSLGNYLIIDHGDGIRTLYGHCSEIYARVGDEVSQYERIAAIGSTGYSTGPHVHLCLYLNGTLVNPGVLLRV